MAKTRFGHLIKGLSFRDYGPGLVRQGTEMNGKFLGYDVNIQYGAYWAAGKMGKPPYIAEAHDFDQVNIWMGLDILGGVISAVIGIRMGRGVRSSSPVTS